MRPLKHFKKLGFLFMIQFITLNSVAQCPDGTNSWFVIDSIDRDAKVVYYTVYSNVAADADVNYSISGTSYYYSGTKYYNFASDSTNIFSDTLNYLGEPYIYFSIIFNKPSECASSYYAYENIDFNCNHSAYVSLSSACESDFNKKVPINYYFNVSSGDTIITLVKDRFGAIIDSFASSNYYYNRTIIFNKVGIDTIYVTFVGQYCTRTQKLGVVVSDACSNFGCSADLTMSHVTGNKYKITVNHPNANFYSWSYGTTYGPTQQKDTTSNSIILDMIGNVVYYVWVAPVDTNQFCYTTVQKQFSSTPCFVQFDDPTIYGSTVNFYIYGLNPDKTYKLYFGDGEDSILNITASNPYASISYNYSNITKDYQAVLVVLDRNDTCNLISKTISFKECYAMLNYYADSNDPQNVGFYVNSFSYSTTKRKLVLDFGDGTQEIKNFVSWTPPISHRYSKPGVYEVSLFVEFYNDSNELVCTDLVKKSVIVGTNPLLASFSYTTSNDTIRFYDNSIGNIVSYNWDFGDGTTASSKNVLHKYKNDGLYTVCLTVKDQNNNINNVCKEIIVGNPLCKLKASFLSYKDSTNQLKVYFINTSLGGQQFYWDFGDGNISTVKNPSHTYAKMGAYTVSLLISDSANCYDRYVQKIYAGVINCLASFDYIANESTRTVSISNSSIAGNSAVYFWNFGDGTFSSVSNPVPKVYTKDGKYKISLLVYDPNTGCDDYIEKVVYINNPCKAIFSYYVDTTNKEIVLQNLSLNSNKYYWAFGDGTYSTLDNPVYTYHKPGIYKVALHVANSTNGCTDLSEAYIRTSPSDDCEADFVYRVNESAKQVYFYNRSLGQINKYFWNFGNGTTSTLMNPSVTYTKSGVYNVCLTVVDNKGISNITCKNVAITSNSCVADYEYLIQPDRKVIFNDRSLGTPTSYTWQFGDNSSGTGRHVEHVYTTNGYYLSSLKIQSGSTCNSIAYKLLNIGMPGRIKAALIANVSNSNNKAGGYPVDFIGAGLGDEVRIKWIFGDGTEDTTTTTPTHVYANPGTYTACYIISDPITEQSDTVCTLVTVTSISTPHYTNEIQIFPVPFGEHLNINLKVANASRLQISLTDLTGRTIRVFENRNIAAGVYNLRYNTLNIKPGTYLLRVQYGNQSSSHVVTKQ